jgi:hypothetical protein
VSDTFFQDNFLSKQLEIWGKKVLKNKFTIIFFLIINIQISYGDENIIIEYNAKYIEIKRGEDADVISNVDIIYRPESDVIVNINDIEPLPIVSEILDKPINNRNISMLSEYSKKDSMLVLKK